MEGLFNLIKDKEGFIKHYSTLHKLLNTSILNVPKDVPPLLANTKTWI